MIEAKGSLTGELNVGTRKEKYAPRFISFYGDYHSKELDKELENLDTSNITYATNMFNGCRELTKLDVSHFNTSNFKDISYMFYGCSLLTELDVSNFDTSNVTNMGYIFSGCSKLTELDVSNFDTSKVEKMGYMFNGCSKLTELDVSNFDTSKVRDVSSMFANMTGLKTLNISNFDLGAVSQTNSMFDNSNFKNLTFGTNLGKAFTQKMNNYSQYRLDLSDNTDLTHDSLMSVINNLYDLNLSYKVATGGTLYRQQLILGSTNLAKLTADEIAIATDKGWNVS